MKDGVDGVVVDKPNRLIEEAKKGVAAVAVQDRYPSGELAQTLLRQVRVARQNDVVPAIVLLTADMAAVDRTVLEKQYKVREFIRISENPIRIAQAAHAAAGIDGSEDDLILHPDERANDFDISVDSVSAQINAALDDSFDDEEQGLKTVEVNAGELAKLRGQLPKPPRTKVDVAATQGDMAAGKEPPTGPGIHPVTQESELLLDNPTSEGLLELSHLPPPGGDADILLNAQPTAVSMTRPTGAAPAPVLAPPAPSRAPSAAATTVSPPSGRTPDADEGNPVHTQDQAKLQTELKRALLAEKKKTEAAQKRVEELEARLAKGGGADAARPAGTGPGVPAEGVFEDLRYAALLARCRAELFTGAIQMQSGGATRTVYLKDGLPVAFHSSEPGERIGKVLMNQGRITEDQYMKATTRSVERSIKLTDALVELGLMDAETVAVEQRNLTRDQIIQSFELSQGRFTVMTGQTPDANTPTFDFGPGEIYVQGYRRYAPSNEMMAAFETLRDKYLIANARLASFRPKLGLATEDERMLRLLGEALTVEEAVERAQVTPEQAARLLSALQALELVDEWSPGVEQFRSRIRGEKQRHAEDLNAVHAEARNRELRLIEAFEKALQKLGVNISLASVADGEAAKPRSPFASSASSGPPSTGSSTGMGGVGGVRSPLSSTTVGASPSSSFGHSAASAASVTVPARDAGSSEPSPGAVVVAPPSPSFAAAGSGGGGSAAGGNGQPAKGRESQQTISLADLKYREGIEQAAQNRLDEAEVTLREAVRLDASKPEYLTALARVLLGNPRYERAGTLPVVRSLLDRAVQLAPDNSEASDMHAQVIKEMSS
ncbi:MAG: hypothetical protein A2138_20285 [Deltaproteobacteria bacterium RBG_16_71_12]|nr:MAG: hypothetical protein A2138_20285 [Deltaproteobacteria bacterium RBG_16_71_12]